MSRPGKRVARRALKSGRIEIRVESAREKRIGMAASLKSQTVSAFMLEAASEKAEQVISENVETVVPAKLFDALWAALSKPAKRMPKMAAVSRAPRRFVQRG